ncbi:MAG: YdcF family protein [Acetobacteraceae bacterium]|nr:YdcF family protein [Acetobacteraceae bacterium]
MKRFIILLARLTGAALLLFLIIAFTPVAWYIGAPLRVPVQPQPSDVIVLFSEGQISPEWLTPNAAQRTWGALLLWRENLAPVILSSGSQHAIGLDQAELQAEWLERAGVPQASLMVENRSRRTYESVLELQQIMHERGWRAAIIVTAAMDVLRIRLVCEKLGIRGISFLAVPEELPPRPGSILYFPWGYAAFHHALYEYAGIALYWMRGWI